MEEIRFRLRKVIRQLDESFRVRFDAQERLAQLRQEWCFAGIAGLALAILSARRHDLLHLLLLGQSGTSQIGSVGFDLGTERRIREPALMIDAVVPSRIELHLIGLILRFFRVR